MYMYMYYVLVDGYNALVHDYNALVDDYQPRVQLLITEQLIQPIMWAKRN